MSNPYFNNSNDLIAGTKARASEVEANFNAVGAGMDLVYSDIQTLQSAVGGGLTSTELDIASASTTTIGVSGNVVRITGTTTINSFGTSYTGVKFIRFAASLTLTNSSSLVLPGGANITTTAGDTCIAVPIGNPASGWRVEDYRRMSLPLIEDDALRLAAAASTYLSQANAASTYASITSIQNSAAVTLSSVVGTNTITANASPAITGYTAGQTFRFIAAGANTGAVTININGQGAKAITKSGSVALTSGDIVSGAALQITYDGTQFQLVSGAGGGAVANGTLYEAGTNLTNSYTVTTGKNALALGNLNVSAGQSLTVPSGSSVIALSTTPSAPNTYPTLAGNQTWTGVNTFSAASTFTGAATFASAPAVTTPQSMVRLNTANGYGSTNTKIQRFANVVTNQGTDITYNSGTEATLGASFTINTSGVYAISFSCAYSASQYMGVSLNTTQPTTSIGSITASDVLTFFQTSAANVYGYCGATVYLPSGSIIRPHSDINSAVGTVGAQFTITRVA